MPPPPLFSTTKKERKMVALPREYTFTLQWHITARCQQHCKHCYMHDEPSYQSELSNELGHEDSIKVIEDT